MVIFEDLYDGQSVTLIDPISCTKCVGELTAFPFPNERGEAFKMVWNNFGFMSDCELKDQSDVDMFKVCEV